MSRIVRTILMKKCFYLDPGDLKEYVGGSGGLWKVGGENDEI